MERYSLRPVNKATLECWHTVLLVNPGPTCCMGWGRTPDSSTQQHRDRINLPCQWCQSWGFTSFRNGKKRSCCSLSKRQSMCEHVGSKSANPNLCLLWKYSGAVWEDSFTIIWYSATSISKYVLLVTASRHHAHAVTWQDFGTGDGPRTFPARREQIKLSVVVVWDGRLPKWNQRRQKTTTAGHPWDLVCLAMAMCPSLAAGCCTRYSCWRSALVTLNIRWAALLTELEKAFRETSISPFPQLRHLIFCLCFQL